MDQIRVVWEDPACEVVVLDRQLVDVEACFDYDYDYFHYMPA